MLGVPVGEGRRVEAESYQEFQREYLNRWRQFFDPVGVRLSLTEKRAKVEVYVLPLISSQDYGSLRWLTGGVPYQFAPKSISPRAVGQLTCNLSILGEGN